jgi:hypothetical protein
MAQRKATVTERRMMAATGLTLSEIRKRQQAHRERRAGQAVAGHRRRMDCPRCGRSTAIINSEIRKPVLAHHDCEATPEFELAEATRLERMRRESLLAVRTRAAAARAWTFRLLVLLVALFVFSLFATDDPGVGVVAIVLLVLLGMGLSFNLGRWRRADRDLPYRRLRYDDAHLALTKAQTAVDMRDIATAHDALTAPLGDRVDLDNL